MKSQKFTDVLESADVEDATVVAAPISEGEQQSVLAVVSDEVETELAKDTLFELLKNERRREALDFLKANGGVATLSDMAEHIAAKENDLPIQGINSKQRKRVYIGLYQCHLPKMKDAGVVDFDKNRGTIKLNDVAAQLYPYLDSATDEAATSVSAVDADEAATESDGIPAQSSALAGIAAAALAGVAGVPGFELLSPVAWVVVCALTLLGVAALPFVRS